MQTDHDCVVFSSNGRGGYRFNYTSSDPYEIESIRSYDQLLHRTLSQIFHELGHTSDQMKELLRAPAEHTDQSSIFKLILKREPALSNILSKRNKLSLLWIAVLCCYQDSAELLVRSGADVNEPYGSEAHLVLDLDRQSSVLHALLWMYPSSWNERFIDLVIDHGADLEARDFIGTTALHFAASRGRVQAFKLLLEKGANIKNSCLTLVDAVRDNNVDLVRILIEKGASLEYKKIQPINLAVRNRNNEMVELLLDHGVNVNARTMDGYSPLHHAARHKDPTLLLTLLRRGANIDLRTSSGKTALHKAAKRKASQNIKILVSFGANLCVANRRGKRPIDYLSPRNMKNRNIRPVLRQLALRKACLQPTIEFKDEMIIEKYYPKPWKYYQQCIHEILLMKSARFVESCTIFELLTKCKCRIAILMRNREFESKFKLYDTSIFSIYVEDILEAFARAKQSCNSVLEQEEVINEAFYYYLPDLVVRKVVRNIINCEICELKEIVHASRVQHTENIRTRY